MRVATLVKKANASKYHSVTHISDTSVTLKRTYDQQWIVELANSKFSCAYRQFSKDKKIFSVKQLAAYLGL